MSLCPSLPRSNLTYNFAMRHMATSLLVPDQNRMRSDLPVSLKGEMDLDVVRFYFVRLMFLFVGNDSTLRQRRVKVT